MLTDAALRNFKPKRQLRNSSNERCCGREVSSGEVEIEADRVMTVLHDSHSRCYGGTKARRCLRGADDAEWRAAEADRHCSKRSNWLAAITVIPNIKWDMTLAGVRTQTCVPP